MTDHDTIRHTVKPGTHVLDAIGEMSKLARWTGKSVTADFNKNILIVEPDDRSIHVVADYDYEMHGEYQNAP